MPVWLRRLALLTIVVLTLPSAVIVAAGFRGMVFPPEEPQVLYLTRSELVSDQAIRLPDATIKVTYLKFAGQRPFAAFAADGTGHWGYAGGKHSVAAARAQALARCLGDCVVVLEYRPAHWQADLPGQTVSDATVEGMAAALDGIAQSRKVYYALAEDGGAVQRPGDDGVLPQWAVLNRCRAMLEPRRKDWPRSLPYPQCRVYLGSVTMVKADGTMRGGAD